MNICVFAWASMCSWCRACLLVQQIVSRVPGTSSKDLVQQMLSPCERCAPNLVYEICVGTCGEGFEADSLWVVCGSMDAFLFT